MAESTRRRPFFPDAFKQEAVAAVRGGRPVSQVAAVLGLPDRLLRWWLRWDERGGAAVRGAPAPTPPKEQAVPARRGRVADDVEIAVGGVSGVGTMIGLGGEIKRH